MEYVSQVSDRSEQTSIENPMYQYRKICLMFSSLMAKTPRSARQFYSNATQH
jgi:hypothetical protein